MVRVFPKKIPIEEYCFKSKFFYIFTFQKLQFLKHFIFLNDAQFLTTRHYLHQYISQGHLTDKDVLASVHKIQRFPFAIF
jgi:hypothetical protein